MDSPVIVSPHFDLVHQPEVDVDNEGDVRVKLGSMTLFFRCDVAKKLARDIAHVLAGKPGGPERSLGECSICRRDQGATYHEHPCE